MGPGTVLYDVMSPVELLQLVTDSVARRRAATITLMGDAWEILGVTLRNRVIDITIGDLHTTGRNPLVRHQLRYVEVVVDEDGGEYDEPQQPLTRYNFEVVSI